MKPKVAFFDFTSCEGCQLTVVDSLQTHLDLLEAVEIVQFREAVSERGEDYAVETAGGVAAAEPQPTGLGELWHGPDVELVFDAGGDPFAELASRIPTGGARDEGVALPEVDGFAAVSGRGARGRIGVERRPALVGSLQFLVDEGIAIDTGEIEVVVSELTVLNPSRPLPFMISGEEQDVDDNARLKYRYLDLRRDRMTDNMILRHRVVKFMRDYLDARGFIEVDEHCRTASDGIWAVGDCVRGPMLAHKGKEEGVMVADRIAGRVADVNYGVIPSVIYTAPEIAWVGKTEKQLKDEGVRYRAGRFPFAYNGRALGRDEPEGFIKVLADEASDRVLGVHAIGGQASELIAEAVMAIEFGASSEDIARICHAHPSMSEVMREAALAVDKRGLNG